MKPVKFILYLILLSLLGGFFSQNNQDVVVNYGLGSISLPLFIVMVTAMIVGCLIVWSYELFHQQRLRRHIKKLTQEVKRLEQEGSTGQTDLSG